MSGTILSGRGLRKVFDGTVAVDNVSFAIEEKTITAIIGPNGAGKTTLFNLITGFLAPDAREIYYRGRPFDGNPPHEIARQGISRTFQDLRLLRQVSVLDNILLAFPNQKGEIFWYALFTSRGRREDQVNRVKLRLDVLDFFSLNPMANEPAGNLSYGQQKLLSLACCLATGGEILLLDEPVSGVHPDMAAQILDRIAKLKDQGMTTVFIEHDIEAVRKIADQVLVMDEGKVIAYGPKDEVLGKTEIVEAYLT